MKIVRLILSLLLTVLLIVSQSTLAKEEKLWLKLGIDQASKRLDELVANSQASSAQTLNGQQTMNLLILNLYLGDIDSAEKALTALEAKPTPDLPLLRAYYQQYTGRLDQAIAIYQNLLELADSDTKQAWLNFRLAQSLFARVEAADTDALLNHLQQAHALFLRQGDAVGEGETLLLWAQVSERKDKKVYQEKMAAVEAILTQNKIPHLKAKYLQYRISQLNLANEFKQVASLLEQVKTMTVKEGVTANKIRYAEAFYLAGIGQRKQAISLLEEIQPFFKRRNHTRELASIQVQLARIYRDDEQFKESTEVFFNQLRRCELAAYWRCVSHISNEIGINYRMLGQPENALPYYEKDLALQIEQHGKPISPRTYNNIGNVYTDMEQYDKALKSFTQASVLSEETGNRGSWVLAEALSAKVLLLQDKPEAAQAKLLKALPIAEAMGVPHRIAMLRRHLSNSYLQLREYDKAIQQLKLSLEYYRNNNMTTSETLRSLVTAYAGLGKFEEAYRYSTEFVSEFEKTTEALRDQITTEVFAKYDTEQKRKEIALLKRENSLQEAELAAKEKAHFNRVLMLTTLALALMLALFLGFAWRENRRVKALVDEKTKALQVKTKSLEQLFDKYIDLYQNFSHEFRTPLNVIQGNLRRLQKEKQQEEKAELLDTLNRNTNHLAELIERVIELSKLETLTEKATLPSVNSVIDEVNSAFRSLLDEQNKKLLLNLESDVTLDFSEESMRMILNNLVSNALKYSNQGSVIEIKTAFGETGNFQLSVIDNGQGIPKAEIPRLFDRFFRSSLNQAGVVGTGLGLAIVKEKVDAAGGSIKVESAIGQGSVFTLTFPSNIVRPTERMDNPNKDGKQIISKAIPNQEAGSLSILAVEDNQDLLNLIEKGLSEQYVVHTANNGQEGFELAKSIVPDLVVTDIDMPIMNGIELLKSIKNDVATSHLPVLLLTAKASIESRIEGWEHEADGYLAKPFQESELTQVCRALIKNREKLRRKWEEGEAGDDQYVMDALTLKFFQQIDHYLDQHLKTESITLDSISTSLHMTKRTFQRKIKAASGMTPSEYIKRFRLRKARELLLAGAAVNVVAAEVGFSSPSYFSKAYRDFFKRSPSEENLRQ